MIERRIVRRYAAALFSAASDANVVDDVESDLGLVGHTVESSPALREVIHSPVVDRSVKVKILQDIFAGKIQQVTSVFLKLLVDKNREEALALTKPEYVLLANQARGIVQAEVISAVPLSKEQQSRLVEKLNATTGKKIQLVEKVEPEISGGIIVRIGDTVIDGSIRGQLAALREQFLS
ncbi:MAG: ATP synthase F1 subunit delta [Armatimonadetes bacterium]|nr:ATP synthase F1 subunit delta [Armatimonadota bacterium]